MTHQYESDDGFLEACLAVIAAGRGLDCCASQSLYDLCVSLRAENESLIADRAEHAARCQIAVDVAREGRDRAVDDAREAVQAEVARLRKRVRVSDLANKDNDE